MLASRAAAGLPIGEDGANQAGYASREALTATDVLSNDLEIEAVPATSNISGRNKMTIVSRVNGLTQFTFMLRSNYTVSSAIINEGTPGAANVAVTTPGANSYARTVTLNRPYNAGEQFTITIVYAGTAVSRGFGSITFDTQNGQPIVSTLSEAYFAATWWPVKDGDFGQPGDNSDKATIKMAITVPSSLSAVSNGLFQGSDVLTGGRTRYRWLSNYPTATYLVFFSATNYSYWSSTYTYPLPGGGTGSMPVDFALYPTSDTPANRQAAELCIDMLAVFRDIYGEYPFINEKYGIYQFPFGGGMEHQTFSGQGSFQESLTAHELAHQWWGNNVTCRTWGDIWLNEGFATYSEALWLERKPGSSGIPALHAAMANRRPSAVTDSVYVYSSADQNRIFSSTYSYRKGAWVLHMLRKALGDATFFDVLREYRAAYQGSGATTDEFTAVASSVSGKDLSAFIRQWVYGVGAPAYVFSSQPATIAGQPYLRARIRQSQNSAWPGAGAPAGYFAMPIDIRVDTAAGSQTITVENNARTQHFLIPLNATATGAALDEFNWVLATSNTTETFVIGPPRVVSMSPGANATPAFAPADIRVQFDQNVTIPAGAATLQSFSGIVPATSSYNAATFELVLTPVAPLPPGAYTVRITDAVTSTAGALDGEVAAPTTFVIGGPLLPSGNGIAGGVFNAGFIVLACQSADFDADGDTGTDADIEAFFACLAGSCCSTCGTADFDGDGDAGTDADIEAFFRVLAGGAC